MGRYRPAGWSARDIHQQPAWTHREEKLGQMGMMTRPFPSDYRGPSIGIVAHECRRRDLLALLCRFVHLLERCPLVATSGAALDCVRELVLPVVSAADDHHGGDLQMAALAVGGSLDAVLFLRDPLMAPSSDATLMSLSQACDLGRVPFATNSETAQAILAWISDEISSKEATPLYGTDNDAERSGARQPVLHPS